MDLILATIADPTAWAARAALLVMEIVLGIDNLVFISIVTNKLPEHQRPAARKLGIGLALVLRIVLLATLVYLARITAPLFDLGLSGPLNAHGAPSFETAFSLRDLILIAGGLFLIWKATSEIHHNIDPTPADSVFTAQKAGLGFGSARSMNR